MHAVSGSHLELSPVSIKSSKLKTAYNPVKKSKFVINDPIEMSK